MCLKKGYDLSPSCCSLFASKPRPASEPRSPDTADTPAPEFIFSLIPAPSVPERPGVSAMNWENLFEATNAVDKPVPGWLFKAGPHEELCGFGEYCTFCDVQKGWGPGFH